jgi:hypothetical protein
MDAVKIVKENIDAWNRRDIEAVVATYAEGATYSNPRAGEGLTVEAIGTSHTFYDSSKLRRNSL